MKKLSILLLVSFFFMFNGIAQKAPRGMKYQAVARDLNGEVLANSKIELKINLLSNNEKNPISHYVESHSVVTNQLGLFTLVVGDGKVQSGDYELVPWSSSDIWMEIQIRVNNQSDFTSISNSKLMAVPYAYYAATAGMLANEILQVNSEAREESVNERCPCEGGLSQIKVLYNGPSGVTIKVYGKKQQKDLLATFASVSNGEILTVNANNYNQGKFKDETFFNILNEEIPEEVIPTKCEETNKPWDISLGETFGHFSVISHLDKKNNAECTVCDINKEWHVGGNGLMDLCNKLGTKSNTDLVLITNNIERIRISKDGNVTLEKLVRIKDSTQSTSSNNGALVVAGGAGIEKNLYVAGDLDVLGNTNLNSITTKKLTVEDDNPGFLATFENTNPDEGDGIKIKLGRTHPAWIESGILGPGYINIPNVGAEYVDAVIPIDIVRNYFYGNPVSLKDFTSFSFSMFPSALVAGAICEAIITPNVDYINDNLHLPRVIPKGNWFSIGAGWGDDIQVPPSNITVVPRIPDDFCDWFPSFSLPKVRLNGDPTSLDKKNQFISFVDNEDRELGSIRAQSIENWNYDYLDESNVFKIIANLVGVDLLGGLMNGLKDFTDLSKSYNSLGVEYASGHGDYAEWLERTDPYENINPGDIVGVRGGKVSKNLEGAEQILAVSHNPIMLGNAQSKEREPFGNKIAFTGQVPVKVMGPVKVGDYIIGRGDIIGYGIAIDPENITTDDLRFTVGRSWETNLNAGPKMVNTLIGVDNGDYIKIMKGSQDKIEKLELRINNLEEKLDQIITRTGKRNRKQ